MCQKIPSDKCAKVTIQISLRIGAVWSDYSQGTFWIAKDAMFFRADYEDSD